MFTADFFRRKLLKKQLKLVLAKKQTQGFDNSITIFYTIIIPKQKQSNQGGHFAWNQNRGLNRKIIIRKS